MPLYLIETKDGKIQQVLRASSPACCRNIAASQAGGEGPTVWRDPERSTVKDINPNGPRNGVILRLEND